MTCANEEETWSGRRADMMIFFSWKSLWKVEEIFLEGEKIVLTLSNFFIVGSFFNGEGSAHDCTHGEVMILGKECVDTFFDFELDALIDTWGMCEMKQEILDSLFKWAQMKMLLSAWWVLLLGLKDELYAVLEAKLR